MDLMSVERHEVAAVRDGAQPQPAATTVAVPADVLRTLCDAANLVSEMWGARDVLPYEMYDDLAERLDDAGLLVAGEEEMDLAPDLVAAVGVADRVLGSCWPNGGTPPLERPCGDEGVGDGAAMSDVFDDDDEIDPLMPIEDAAFRAQIEDEARLQRRCSAVGQQERA